MGHISTKNNILVHVIYLPNLSQIWLLDIARVKIRNSTLLLRIIIDTTLFFCEYENIQIKLSNLIKFRNLYMLKNKFNFGLGIGGWLTNYKRFNVLPTQWRTPITIGDLEHFESYITQKDINYIASLGVDHIRLGFDQIVIESAIGEYREETLKHIDNFIKWCEEANVFPILNLHKAIGNYCDIKEEVTLFDSNELQQRFINLWLMLEKRYSAKPNIAFELLNEVRDIPPALWNSLLDKTIMALRALNKERILIIGPTNWGSPAFLKHLNVYDDPNIIYTYHFYEPNEFTHQRGVLMANTLYYNRDMPYPCDDIERYREFYRLVFNRQDAYKEYKSVDKEYLRVMMQPAFDWVKTHPDKTLWLGEFGTIRHCKLEWRINYMQDVMSLAKEYNIGYCAWNYLSTPNDGNRFSLVDDDTRQLLHPLLINLI